jgi:hypothetical protein
MHRACDFAKLRGKFDTWDDEISQQDDNSPYLLNDVYKLALFASKVSVKQLFAFLDKIL